MGGLLRAVAVACVAALALTACGGTKAGGTAKRHLTIVMQTPDAPDASAEYFIQQVKARTHGHVVIVEGADFSSADPDNEARLVRALRDGDEKLAYIPSRAWERASTVTAFRALQAPLLVTGYPLLRGIATGPVGRSMLASLDRIGIVGLGLVPDELRRPLGRKPLDSPAAFRGARIRVVTSPTSVLALRSLGAVPLTNFTSRDVADALAHGKLDGVESSTRAIGDNEYVHLAPYLPSNLALFAKTQTIAMPRSAFAELPPADRAALRAAAAATVAHADPAAQERSELIRLCGQGLRVVVTKDADVALLRRAAAAAYTGLERDPATRAAIHSIERLERSQPTAASPLPRCARPVTASKPATAVFPQGRFASTITAADFRRGGATQESGFPVPFVLTFRDGRWHTNEHPQFGGRYVVHGDEITFIIERPHENSGQRETVSWSLYRGKLTFGIVSVEDSGSRVIYTAHAWRRVG
jgi:TRAP-type C4-dicarboxylate transport system substrate-binding protein